ncbi:Syntaxin-6 [Nowakowskiella sp. JEL0407]|nr:Syntaxin-6 [Nowakowskiella sp. JEL0407]
MSEDPFFAVKDEVEMSVLNASQLYQTWCRLLDAQSPTSTTSTSTASTAYTTTSEEYKWTTQELKSSLTTIELDLRDLDETIKIVESNPEKFKLDLREIANRKEFIARTKKTVLDMKTTINNPTSAKSKEAAQRNALLSPSKPKQQSSPSEQRPNGLNSRFIEHEQQTQQIIMRQQDDQLDSVLDTVHGLKEVAHVMGRELEDQTRLLGDLENQVDTTQGKLQLGMKRMQEVIKANASMLQNVFKYRISHELKYMICR